MDKDYFYFRRESVQYNMIYEYYYLLHIIIITMRWMYDGFPRLDLYNLIYNIGNI